MAFTYFLTFHDPAQGARRASGDDLARIAQILRTAPGLVSARIYTPAQASDPYLNDGAPPQLALQLYFTDIADLEAALAQDGPLQALAAPGALPSLGGLAATQQAMVARRFPVPDPVFRTPAGQPHCTYLVSYQGEAEDLNAWHDHYIRSHPPIMAQFPAIREIEICTRLDWRGFLPWPRVAYMQRNKVVFDSAAALDAALNSPVRHLMRADFNKFPPFTGANTHYPMATVIVTP